MFNYNFLSDISTILNYLKNYYFNKKYLKAMKV